MQDANEPPSSRHSKDEPPSVEVKLKSALEALLGSAGLAVIDVSGAVVSTVHVYVCGAASALPAGVGRLNVEGVAAVGEGE